MDQQRPVRYAIYTRQSSLGNSAVLSSCAAQFAICEDFAQARASTAWTWVGQRFDDVGESGADTKRPALQRLLGAIRARAIDKLIIYRLDRLSRNLRDSLDILQSLQQNGVELLIVTSPDLGSAASDVLALNIMASFAQFERDMIRSRLADSQAARKRRGYRLSGPPPFGYAADPRTRQLQPDQAEAEQVRAIFSMAAAGKRPSAIAEEINGRGWRTKRYVAWRSGRTHGGRLWTARQVVELLRNPVYAGEFRDDRGTRPGCHPPIIDAALFQAAQAALDARRITSAPRSHAVRWPLRGKIVCPNCGRAMGSYMVTRGDKRAKRVYRYYRCRSTAGGQPPCRGIQYPAFEVEAAVCRLLADEETWRQIVAHRPFLETRVSALRTAWQALDDAEQLRMLTRLIHCAQLDGKRETLTVEFSPDLVEALERRGGHG